MPTVKLVPEDSTDLIVAEVFADIKATKKIDFIPAIWRALATHPQHLQLCWTRLQATMQPGKKIDLPTKEIIALAVSATNGCNYCINSHTAVVQKLGLDNQSLGEVQDGLGALFVSLSPLQAGLLPGSVLGRKPIFFILSSRLEVGLSGKPWNTTVVASQTPLLTGH
jgi:AhpD family alkylhydroperoxidase